MDATQPRLCYPRTENPNDSDADRFGDTRREPSKPSRMSGRVRARPGDVTKPTTTVAAALGSSGAKVIFGMPGGGPNLEFIGAAADCGIRFVLAHAETSAAIMASTFGLLTGTPSAVVVTRGPGAASVVNGVAQATLDRYPLVVITDTVSAADATRVPHQRIAQRDLMAPVAKATATISATSSEGDILDLITLANSVPRGAVHLDIDATAASEAGAAPGSVGSAASSAASTVAKVVGDEAAARRLIQDAARPVFILGMNAIDCAPTLRPILDRLGAPVLTTYQAIGCVPTEGPLHAGLFTNGATESHLLADADLIVIIGLDLVEPIPKPWTQSTPVLSITPVPTTDRYLPIEIELIGDPVALISRLLDGGSSSWPPGSGARYRETSRAALRPPKTGGDGFGPVDLVETVSRLAPSDATITVDAGAHFLAVMPFWPVEHPLQLLISNGLATMGFSVPAAIGAALARPGRPVVCLTGDGGLAMTLGELETIARLDVPVTVVVFNDAALTLIELKQSPNSGGREVVRFGPVDFGAQARAAGLAGCIVKNSAELEEALEGGWDHPRLIDARIDPSDYRHLITVTRG